MKHPNKKLEAFFKYKAKYLISYKKNSAFNFWLRDNYLERK